MNKWRNLTGYLLMASVFIIAIYDVFIIQKGGKEASISQVLIDYSYQYPIGVFALGVVCGHLFWRMPDKYKIDKKEYEKILEWRNK